MHLPVRQHPRVGLDRVLDCLPHAVFMFDGAGRVAFANRAAGKLVPELERGDGALAIGDLAALLGSFTCVDGIRVPSEASPFALLARNESFARLEFRPTTGAAKGSVLSFTGTIGSDDDGEPFRVLLVEDVSHVYERESLFRTAFESGPVPVTLVRGSDSYILDVNRAFLELLGYQRGDLVGRTVPELALLWENEALLQARDRLGRGEDIEGLELVVRAHDGGARTLLSWLKWVEVGGEACLLTVYVDVSEQKEMERRLREATQVVLESASVFSRSVVEQLEHLRGPEVLPESASEIGLLTRRERHVVSRIGAGQSNQRIAQELDLTPQTVRNYVTRIYRKIGVKNRAEAVVWARERGLVVEG